MNLSYDNSRNRLFSIVESDGRSFVDLSTIVRLVADGTCTWIVFANGKRVLTTKNLGYYEKVLPLPDISLIDKFFRVHHKHLVNLSYMSKYNRKEKLMYLSTEDSIPIAQRRVKGFTCMLRRFSLY